MFDRLADGWLSWPAWARWTSAIAVVVALDALAAAWGQRNFGSSFLASFTATSIYHARSIGSIVIGAYIGFKTASYYKKGWPGWIVGILCILVLFEALGALEGMVPGAAQRLHAIDNSDCHTEWDGRSNPTVCD